MALKNAVGKRLKAYGLATSPAKVLVATEVPALGLLVLVVTVKVWADVSGLCLSGTPS